MVVIIVIDKKLFILIYRCIFIKVSDRPSNRVIMSQYSSLVCSLTSTTPLIFLPLFNSFHNQ